MRLVSSLRSPPLNHRSSCTRRPAGTRHRRTRNLELRTVALEIAVEIPDDGVGVENSSVVEFHARSQVKNPGLAVVGILFPALGQPRPQAGQTVRPRQVPEHKALEDRIAEKAHALEPVVGKAGCRRDIGRSHGDPKRAFGAGKRLRPKTCQQGRDAANPGNEHGHPLCHVSVTRFRCKLRTKSR
jgi:hypothetical protein